MRCAFIADTDGDGVLDVNDNCPTIATLWIVPPNDPDCDGFTTADENFYGTDPLVGCVADGIANNEPLPDVWPTDLNDSQVATTADVGFMIVPLNTFAPGPPVYGEPRLQQGRPDFDRGRGVLHRAPELDVS